jgi:hypothetical protein
MHVPLTQQRQGDVQGVQPVEGGEEVIDLSVAAVYRLHHWGERCTH